MIFELESSLNTNPTYLVSVAFSNLSIVVWAGRDNNCIGIGCIQETYCYNLLTIRSLKYLKLADSWLVEQFLYIFLKPYYFLASCSYINGVAEAAKKSPELIQLLELHTQFASITPYAQVRVIFHWLSETK